MPLDMTPEQVLRWYIEAGVDETVGTAPVDRFAVTAARPAAAAAAAPPQHARPERPPAAAAAPHPHGDTSAHVTSAHVAAACATLEELKAALLAFEDFAWKRFATNLVFGDGNPEAKVMCIGEAPGPEEDRQGVPFVGPSGKLLDRMLASIGLDRATNAYITNVVPWKPPADIRKPGPDEVAVCLPFITRHIELVDPELLILFGGAAASALLARHEGINRLRGRWVDYSSPGLPRPVPVMATFHPAYLLRTPEAKRLAWRDLLMVKKRLEGAG
ncbi:MAG: uracil-DNA glycosylase [Magnetospirillum sp.]|nr:uracil-DNA glycosylase [Magnetospirillum sp.]